MRRSSTIRLSVAAGALVASTIFGQLSGDAAMSRELQNFAHAPVFFVIAWLGAGYWGEWQGGATLSARQYIALFAICVALGIGIEVLQDLLGRDAQLRDVAADALGTVAGLAWHASRAPRGSTAPAGAGRLWLLWAIPVAMVAAAAPLVWCLAAYVHRDMRFPVLADYRSALDLYFLETRHSRILNRPPLPWSRERRGGEGMLIELEDGDWPGVNFLEPVPDWQDYNMLRVELANPEAYPLDLVVRVHDSHHDLTFDDRFNVSVHLQAGSHTRLGIPLADIAAAPEGRTLDLASVAGIMVFGEASPAGARLLVGKIWLE